MPHNFLNLESKDDSFRKGIYQDPFDEPTYLTFALDFDFEAPSYSKGSGMFDQSPLFAENTDNGAYSCSEYLTNRGYPNLGENIIRFKNLLRYLTFSAPWYFQSIKGLNTMWEQATDMNYGYKAKEIELEVETLEAVDLRISNLASLYRNAVYDMKYMRERVPDNMRWFKMSIWVAEFRNLRNVLPALVQVGNLTSVNLGSLGGLAGASAGDPTRPTSTANVLSNFGFMKFNCRQCEFDFSPTFVGGNDVGVGADKFKDPNTGMFKIKVGWFEEDHDYASGDQLSDDWSRRGGPLNDLSNLPIVGDKLSSLSSKATENIQQFLNTPNNLIGQASQELQNIVEQGSFGQVNPFGYESNGDQIPENTAVPRRQNGTSL